MYIGRTSFVLLISVAYVAAQTTGPPEFEVAAIKVVPDPPDFTARKQPLPRSLEDKSVFESYSSLFTLLARAYQMERYQEILGPEWIRGTYYEIHAKMPEGATRNQVPDMIRALLSEQLKVSAHFEEKEANVFTLTVAAGGVRLTEAPNDRAADSQWAPKGKAIVSSMGPSSGPAVYSEWNGKILYETARISMASLVQLFSAQLGEPVVDQTELKGAYQVSVSIPGEAIRKALAMARGSIGMPIAGTDGPSGAEMASALAPLGLKLEKRRLAIKNLVVDHVEKTPIGH